MGARYQRIDGQVLRTDAVERRQRAAEHVIKPGRRIRPLQRPQIGDIGDNDDGRLSRRGSVQTVQGFCVSMLPQVLQTCTLSIATCSAGDSGDISASRFLIRCSAARRAERGPSPGNRASSWISRSISGPATADGISQARIPAAASSRRSASPSFPASPLPPCAGVAQRRDDQILDDLAFLRLHQRSIDLHAT